MLKFLINGRDLPFLILPILLPTALLAQDPMTELIQSEASVQSSYNLVVAGQTGVLQFQNILLPTPSQDGKPGRANVSNQKGISLGLAFEYTKEFSDIYYRSAFSYIQAVSVVTGTERQQSTPGYVGYTWAQLLDYPLTSGWKLSPEVVLQRTLFKDGSYQHVLDSISLGAETSLAVGELWNVSFSLQQSLAAKIGFTDRQLLKNNPIPGSSARVSAAAIGLKRRFGDSSFLALGLSREDVRLSYPAYAIYQKFGFAIAPSDSDTRQLHLYTQGIQFSLGKSF